MLNILLFLESLGGGELLLILLFILIFFGSSKIPDLARGLGKGMREFKDAMNGVQNEIRSSMSDATHEINTLKQELPVIEPHPLSQSNTITPPQKEESKEDDHTNRETPVV